MIVENGLERMDVSILDGKPNIIKQQYQVADVKCCQLSNYIVPDFLDCQVMHTFGLMCNKISCVHSQQSLAEATHL
jgi:hypothetical protein